MTNAGMLDDLLDAHRRPPAREPWRDLADAAVAAGARDEDEDSDEDAPPAAVHAPPVPDTARNPWASHGAALRALGWCAIPVSFPGGAVAPGVGKAFVPAMGKAPGEWTREGWRPFAGWSDAEAPTETALRAYAAWPESNIGLRLPAASTCGPKNGTGGFPGRRGARRPKKTLMRGATSRMS